MAKSMLESILGMVTPELKQSISSRLGESPQRVESGLTTATAATVAGLATNSGNPGFIDQVMQFASHAGSQNLQANLGSIVSGGPSGALDELVNHFQSLVFGSQQGRVENMVSQQAGLSTTSAGGLLKMAPALVLGYLSKLRNSGSLSAGTLGNMLRAEAPSLGGYIPSGFFGGTAGTVAESAGWVGDRVSEAAGRTGERVSEVGYRVGARETRYAAPPGPTSRRMWGILAAIAGVLLLALLALRGMHTRAVRETANRAVNSASGLANTAGNAASGIRGSLGAFENVTLPDGTQIHVPSNGVEVKLVEYLQGNTGAGGGAAGIDFDRLLFDTNSATLQPASYEQLNNIAAILKAYPTAKIQLRGYTDNTGDASQNLQLSQQRADNVSAELARRGIDSSRLTATGYGQDQAVADNSSEEGRQRNRRISIRVAEK
jgi:outer membrane protein OmpA-like peptidoglycan-associated protein